MFCHLAAFAGLVVPALGHVGGPLLVWLLKREQSPFIDAQGKEALNFQLTVIIITAVVCIIGLLTCGIGLIILLPVLIVLGVVDVVFPIIAAIRANNGEYYRYPFSLRIIA